jgi:uncharacterized protein (TIGR03067 family)
MRKSLALTGVVVCVMLLGSDSPRGDRDAATRVDGLEGTWIVLAVEANGKRVQDEDFLTVTSYHFKAGTLTDESRSGQGRFIYTTDVSQKPAHLDLRVDAGPRPTPWLKAILQIDGDHLKVGWSNKTDDSRPTSWDDPRMTVLTFRRGKS